MPQKARVNEKEREIERVRVREKESGTWKKAIIGSSFCPPLVDE